ncbi:MAG: DUF6428 family protein [Pseudomonadota bacterium]
MTLDDLLSQLETADSAAPVLISADGAPIGDGYHITELKRADVTSIDCGGRISSWREAELQIFDGAGGGAMPAGKMAGIIRKSVAAVEGLGGAPLRVEFGAENRGLRRYSLSELTIDSGVVEIALISDRAACKPMADALSAFRHQPKSGPQRSSCC